MKESNMKIVSTTITRNRQDVIVEAIESVSALVSDSIIIDMGATDATIDRVKDLPQVHICHHPWADHFAKARNDALQEATQLSPDWILTIDTDERLIVHDQVKLLNILQDAPETVSTFHVSDAQRTYVKQRFFRPNRGRWIGRTHEYYETAGTTETIPPEVVVFVELPKTFTHTAHKYERDLRLLRVDLIGGVGLKHRWHYYLGTVYEGLYDDFDHYRSTNPSLAVPLTVGNATVSRPIERVERAELSKAAIHHYEACAKTTIWDEEKGFSHFRAAKIYSSQDSHDKALEHAKAGFCEYPASAELAWMASISCYYSRKYQQAMHWGRLATELSDARPPERLVPIVREGFRDLFGATDGAFGALWWAAKAMGQPATVLDEIDAQREKVEFARTKVITLRHPDWQERFALLKVCREYIVRPDGSVPVMEYYPQVMVDVPAGLQWQTHRLAKSDGLPKTINLQMLDGELYGILMGGQLELYPVGMDDAEWLLALMGGQLELYPVGMDDAEWLLATLRDYFEDGSASACRVHRP